MKLSKATISFILLSMSFMAVSAEWSHNEIRAVGKSMISMTGFYVTCSKKGLVKINQTSVRWSSFMGTKYLVIAGIESEQKRWVVNGAKGILIEDPTKSEKTMEVKFNKKSCLGIKQLVDAQYFVANNYISGDYKNNRQ